MAASSKRKSDEDEDLFKYGNAMQFSFGKKPRTTKPAVVRAEDLSSADESESDDENSSSDSEEEDQWKRTENVSSDEESEAEEVKGVGALDGTNDSQEFLSPSPPPPPRVMNVNVNRKVSKQTASSLKTLNNVLRVLNEEHSPSPTMFTPRARSHLGNDIMLLDDTSPSGREIMVKIKCHGIVNKYKINEKESFTKVINQIAAKENVLPERVLLYLGEKTIHGHETPAGIHCTVADILECVIAIDNDDAHEKNDDDGKITIKIQTNEAHSKKEYQIFKTAPVQTIIEKYCMEKNLQLNKVKIYFDGEVISLKDTPMSLDMDNDDILDLVQS